MNKFIERIYFEAPYIMRSVAINIYGYWMARQRFGGDFNSILEQLNQSQWWDKAKLEDYQNDLLRSMIVHAYETVPYYRRVFKENNLKPEDIRNADDLKKLPFLSKEIINSNFKDLISKNIPTSKMVYHHTSGTTGVKLKGFYLTRYLRWTLNHAFLYRFYGWGGFKKGDKRVTIGGRFFTKRPPYWAINYAENQLLLSSHHLNDDTVDIYLEKIRKFRPKAIQGHPSAIHYLALRLNEKGQSLPVKVIFTTGEQLFNDQRDLIEDRFCAPIFNLWGHGEAAGMAGECEHHQGFHIASEYGILEIIPDPSYGNEVGEIVVTSLHNYAMPFIRYKTGDLGILSKEKCKCGRGLPLLKTIIGRIDDIILTPEGKIVLPLAFRTLLSKFDYLDQYKFIQQSSLDYKMYIKDNGKISSGKIASILEVLNYLLGNKAKIRIELVKEIPRTPGGKQRLIENRANFR